jgi:hypothetical protein
MHVAADRVPQRSHPFLMVLASFTAPSAVRSSGRHVHRPGHVAGISRGGAGVARAAPPGMRCATTQRRKHAASTRGLPAIARLENERRMNR